MKNILRGSVVFILSILLTGCAKLETDSNEVHPKEKYTYQYTDAYGVERQLSIDYYDEFLYCTDAYYGATAESEASPDWGINIYFSTEKDSDFLYFYGCFGKGYQPMEEYPDKETEVIPAGEYKLMVIDLEEEIIGYSSMGTESGQGILLRMSKTRWLELSDTILELIASAQYN